MLVKVKSLIGEPQDITLKDGTVIKKQQFLAEDNKVYSTFAKVEAGQEYDGTVENDTRSGELRFKKTKVPFTPRGGGAMSDRQVALLAACSICVPGDDVYKLADLYVKWLEAGSQGQGTVAQPTQTATQGVQNPATPVQAVFPGAEELPPVDSYEGME